MRPIPLLAVATMAINDHHLKYAYPGLITGKLSDFLGVFYFPIFLLGLGLPFRKADILLKRRHVLGAIVLTDTILLALKLSPVAAGALTAFFERYLFSIRITADPTDLWALLMNPLSWAYLMRFRSANTRR